MLLLLYNNYLLLPVYHSSIDLRILNRLCEYILRFRGLYHQPNLLRIYHHPSELVFLKYLFCFLASILHKKNRQYKLVFLYHVFDLFSDSYIIN